MFDYLKKYGLSDEEVNALTNSLEENDLYSLMNQYRVEKDLEYFSTLGINNHKQIILNAPFIFINPPSTLDRAIKNCKEENIIDLIKEDPRNLILL